MSRSKINRKYSHSSTVLSVRTPTRFNLREAAGGSPSTVLVQASKVGKISYAPSSKWRRTHQHPNPYASIESLLEQLDLPGMSCAEHPRHHSIREGSLEKDVRDWNYLILANGGKINILYLTRGNREFLSKE